MRILQIGGLGGPGPIAGGVWRVAETQSEVLRSRGHEVHLIGLWLGPQEKALADHGDTHLLECRQAFPGAGLRGLFVPGLEERLSELSPFDIAHVHLSRDYFTMRSLHILGQRGTPVVVQTHGMLTMPAKRTTRLFDGLFKGSYLKVPSLWLCLTETERAGLIRLGVRSSLIEPVVNAVLPSGLTWNPRRPGYALFASRLHPRKGADIFVKAALAVLEGNPEARFVIVGPNEGSLEEVQSLIDDSGSDRFEILGAIELSRVRKLLAGARCLVLPSRGEIAPMVVIEACEIGTPVVLTNDCGLSMELANAGAARIVEPLVAPVAEAMGELLADSGAGRELSVNANLHYRDTWAPECVGETLEKHYSDLI